MDEADGIGCILGIRANGDSSQGVRASTSDLQGESFQLEAVRAYAPVCLGATSQIQVSDSYVHVAPYLQQADKPVYASYTKFEKQRKLFVSRIM